MATASASRSVTCVWPVERPGEDGFGPYLDCAPTKAQLAEGVGAYITVLEEEQRGFDPASGKELLNKPKMDDWIERELEGRLFVGQLNYALHIEAGASCRVNGDGDAEFTGHILMMDGRQRSYVIKAAKGQADQYGYEYDADERLSVRVYLEAPSKVRKEIYAQLNGGRGGDHASKSSVEWMAPEGHLQHIAKHLVEHSPHLGLENVNVKKDSVARKDKRIAGHHTFVKAIENAWGKGRALTQAEAEALKAYLVEFYDQLAEVRPEVGRLELGERQKARSELLSANPLMIHGALAVAKRLYDEDPERPPLERLKVFAGEEGDEFFSLENELWKRNSVLLPRYDRRTGEIKSYGLSMTFQSRKAIADAMIDHMHETLAD